MVGVRGADDINDGRQPCTRAAGIAHLRTDSSVNVLRAFVDRRTVVCREVIYSGLDTRPLHERE
jgi:hypothetical protein